MYIYIHTYKLIYTYIYACMLTYLYMCPYIHIYTHIHSHTLTHTHPHTHFLRFSFTAAMYSEHCDDDEDDHLSNQTA